MTERTLDWRKSKDPRNANFLMANLDCYASGRAHANAQRTKGTGHYLDQGSEGACTGFGASNVLLLGPRHQWWVTDQTAQALYHEAQTLDEWPGEDYEGSSVNGAMLALKKDGRVKSYHWVRSTAEVRHAISYHGAVEMGSDWYEGMWEPDSKGFLNVTGDRVGGHAWALSGYKTVGGSFVYRMENSWNRSWGLDGGALLSEAALARLLADGEGACPVKVAA